MGLHVGQVDDGAVVGHKGCGEGDEGVFHPKTLCGGLLKYKQHAFVRGHVGAKHQACAALIGGLGHLGVDLIHARLQFDARQVGLRAVLGLCGCTHEQVERETKRAQSVCEEVGRHGADFIASYGAESEEGANVLAGVDCAKVEFVKAECVVNLQVLRNGCA